MDLARLRTETRRTIVLATLSGEVDLSNAPGLATELTAAVPNTALELVLDLSEVSYLDSAGVSMLFALSRQLQARQQKLHLVVPPAARIARLLTVTGIETIAQLSPDVERALVRTTD
jgi:anti-anti-sigma factor